jgi:hypothetical protein
MHPDHSRLLPAALVLGQIARYDRISLGDERGQFTTVNSYPAAGGRPHSPTPRRGLDAVVFFSLRGVRFPLICGADYVVLGIANFRLTN